MPRPTPYPAPILKKPETQRRFCMLDSSASSGQGKQTPQPGPTRPRPTNPILALPGALGLKGVRDREPRRSGVREPRRSHPAASSPPPTRPALRPAAGPRAHSAAASPTPALRLLLWLRGREKRDQHFPRPPPPGRFRFRRSSGISGGLPSGAGLGPYVHVGCGTLSSTHGSHVESGCLWGDGARPCSRDCFAAPEVPSV